jgi:hypothetical protein
MSDEVIDDPLIARRGKDDQLRHGRTQCDQE